jgi:hypothetical protein
MHSRKLFTLVPAWVCSPVLLHHLLGQSQLKLDELIETMRAVQIENDQDEDQDQPASSDELVSVLFLKDLIKLHSTFKQQWLLLPTRADGRFTNAVNSNVFLPRAIGMSDKDFVEALFLNLDSDDAKIKYLQETFGVKVASLQIGLSLSTEEKGHVESSGSKILCINFDPNAPIETGFCGALSESTVPAFYIDAFEEAKAAISDSNFGLQHILIHLLESLRIASKPPNENAWYILFSKNPKAKENPAYDGILSSPRLLSRMVRMEADAFSTEILKEKSRKQSVVDFLKAKYNVEVVVYKKVHQIIIFDKELANGWTPRQEDFAELPHVEAVSLGQQRTHHQTPATPLTITCSSPSNGHFHIVSPTNSDSGSPSAAIITDTPSPTNSDSGSPSEQTPEITTDDLVLQLICHAAFAGGTTKAEFQEGKQYPWKNPEDKDSREWSKQIYVHENCDHVLKPLLHAYLQQDPQKFYQLVSLMIEEDDNVREVFQAKFIDYATREKKTVKGFSSVLRALIDSVADETSPSVDTSIVESLRGFLIGTKSKGTRRTPDQQAVDAVLTAVMFENDDNDDNDMANLIRKRLGVTRQSIDKALSKVSDMCKNSLEYDHSVRARRRDCKLDAARSYVYEFCHNQEADRVTKNDTGDFKMYDIFEYDDFPNSSEGRWQKHMQHRWIDSATKDDPFALWEKSRFASAFRREHPEMESICKNTFWKLVCPCCRFGKHDQCSDMIMSGLEEARDGMEKALKASENKEIGEDCDKLWQDGSIGSSVSRSPFLSSFRQRGEEIVESTLCPRKEYPQWTKITLPKNKPGKLHDLGCVRTNCQHCNTAKMFDGVQSIVEEKSSPTHLYPVKLWKKVPILNTEKKQDEIKEENMTLSKLLEHYLRCLEAARKHFVMYKIESWNRDLLKYNFLRQDAVALAECDYAATPDLYPHRTATGQVYTHAVIEPFIVYEDMRDENGVTSCTTRSHIYVGGCEGKGKKNDWQFHIACVHDIIDRMNAKREKEGRAPLREFIVVTDRCPTQYLCRQNFLQIAKSGTVIRHCYACKFNFKGRHDSEGGVLKTGNTYNVMRNESGTTPWELYLGGVKNHTLTENDTEKSNNSVSNINTRDFSFVVYSEEQFDELNQGEHEGKIILANMNITDDTKPVEGTQKIYMARGFGASPPAGLHRIEEETLQYTTWQLDEIANINQDSEDEDKFCERITDEDNLDLSDQVRLDFIRSKNGEIESLDVLCLSKKPLPYLDEFLTRIGKQPLPKAKQTKIIHIQKWFVADKNSKVFIHRRS